MAGGMPEGLEIEQIWVVEATLGPDAAERRAPVRAEHLSASLLLVRVPTQEQALALAEADVYFRSGVWTGFRIRALGRVVRKAGPAAG